MYAVSVVCDPVKFRVRFDGGPKYFFVFFVFALRTTVTHFRFMALMFRYRRLFHSFHFLLFSKFF